MFIYYIHDHSPSPRYPVVKVFLFKNKMKHQTLRIVAFCLGILAWVVIVVGVVVSIIIGIGAATAVAKVGFLLAGLIGTAIIGLLFIGASKMIVLFIQMEEDLSRIADKMDKKDS